MNLKSQVEDFLVFLKNGDYSPNTVRNYASILRRFADFTSEVTKDSVKAFYDSEVAPKSRNSKAMYYAALNQFFTYLIEEAFLISENPLKGNRIPKPKQSRPVPRDLNPRQAKELRRKIKGLELWLRAALTLIAYGGLRASEVTGLTLDSIVFCDSEMRLTVIGKGDKVRVLPFYDGTEVFTVLKEHHRREKAMRGAGPLFLNTIGAPLSYQQLKEWWDKKVSSTATPHQLRHTVGREMTEAGTDLLTVSWFMGHDDIKTTMRYANKSKNIMSKEIEGYQRGK